MNYVNKSSDMVVFRFSVQCLLPVKVTGYFVLVATDVGGKRWGGAKSCTLWNYFNTGYVLEDLKDRNASLEFLLF